MHKSDNDKDGLINEREWKEHINKHSGKFMEGNMYAGSALRVVLYSPSYTCNPPALFLILSKFPVRGAFIKYVLTEWEGATEFT